MQPGGLYLASTNHALHIEFAGASPVQPQSNGGSDGQAAPHPWRVLCGGRFQQRGPGTERGPGWSEKQGFTFRMLLNIHGRRAVNRQALFFS